ncbi:MAG TPA: hypothetical protein VEI28_02095, partial [Thermodesulfovibrionales bacterium]|nr:hypothetical protein [Thermodesulfovibrionales bacterium]
ARSSWDGGGISLNDEYLEGLPLERDSEGLKIVTRGAGGSSIPGLFVLGALLPRPLPSDHLRRSGSRGCD